jgi:hypothetical protein
MFKISLNNLIGRRFVIRRVRRTRRANRRGSNAQYLKYKEKTRILVENRISEFNKFYNYKINRIAIRNQRTRWGSCSKHGNLNFNYKLALIPEKLADYVIVHEICHLGEFNHSKNFWDLVEKTIPDYKTRREELMKINSEYFKNYTESALD